MTTVKPVSSKKFSNNFDSENTWLRRFAKLTCYSTLFLIFAGGMVKSTDSGLAVPDWPLSYGTLFPPMVGGVFYEHGHRMIATLVGFFTLILSIWLFLKENRRWMKVLGLCALLAVIVQGVLGGITVLYFLPTPISVSHGVLAHTFFVLTIIIAYNLSKEHKKRDALVETYSPKFLKFILFFIGLIYFQLIFGAIMRHTESGLAIPDFPKMGGMWLPSFNDTMLSYINLWRFDHNMDPVTQIQVIWHAIHRAGALVVVIAICVLNALALKYSQNQKKILSTVFLIDFLIFVQVTLGITTILTQKSPIITSLHVVTAAAILGTTVLLFLRAAPKSIYKLKQTLNDQ